MDAFLAHADKSHQGHSFRPNGSACRGHQDSSSSNNSLHKYSPYDKESDHGRLNDSFQEGHKLTLCLRCGAMGHRAGNCSAMKSNHPDGPIICKWKTNQLMSKYDETVCIMFNIRGSCTEQPSFSHGLHVFSWCNDSNHATCHCTKN